MSPQPDDVFSRHLANIRESEPLAVQPEFLGESVQPYEPDDDTTYTSQWDEAELESFRQDTAERKKYAGNIFGLMILWVFFIIAVIIWQGSKLVQFEVTENVLLALVVTTTANILGLFVIVANYLFPTRSSLNPSKKTNPQS